MSTEVLVAIITGLFGGSGLTALTNYLILRQKAKQQASVDLQKLKQHQHDLTIQRPIEHYNSLVGHLTKRVDDLETDLEKCSQHHIQCATEVGELRGRISTLSEIVEKWFEKLLSTASQSGVNIHVDDPEKLKSMTIQDTKSVLPS